MLRIGLTGGIGAGKSTAATRFGELGARVIDHDVLARRVVEPGSGALADIVGEFGDRIVTAGQLDRAALAAIVFTDDHARDKLNEIIHPYVFAAADAADRQARNDGVGVVVHDIPLLVETGRGGHFDMVVCVEAPVGVRLARLKSTRGMTREQALQRIGAQATDVDRALVCDVHLDGAGTTDALRAQVDWFWKEHFPS
ncbi:dephospho-CoA kinase [Demequina lutea]|uniref:Dephospho-CoA kinase n=1 Tax=Demequina lutea TaxID=431489 RepID=A0A7Y9ZBI0_9MICO|nr:dephospho-CoA kinase [Demequina lutea]NYI41538.1 dephospho-CoA kinase [Demequina lutea]